MTVSSQLSSLTGANGVDASLPIGYNATYTPGSAGQALTQPLGSWAHPSTNSLDNYFYTPGGSNSSTGNLSIYAKNIPLGGFNCFDNLFQGLTQNKINLTITGYWLMGPVSVSGGEYPAVSANYGFDFNSVSGSVRKTGSLVGPTRQNGYISGISGEISTTPWRSSNLTFTSNSISSVNTIANNLLSSTISAYVNAWGLYPNNTRLSIQATWVYNYQITAVANLIVLDGVGTDSIQPITADTTFTATAQKILPGEGAADFQLDNFSIFSGLNFVGFPYRSLHTGTEYFEADYIEANYSRGLVDHIFEYTADDYVATDYFATEIKQLDADLGQQYTIDTALNNLGGLIQESGNVAIEIANTLTTFDSNVTVELTNTPSSEFTLGCDGEVLQSATLTPTLEFALSSSAALDITSSAAVDASLTTALSPGVIHNGISSATIDLEFSNTYFQGEYVEAGYIDISQAEVVIGDTLNYTADFSITSNSLLDIQGASTLPIEFSTNIETTVEHIPTANLSADADIQGQGGYLRTSGNVTFDSASDISISQYITGGTGVIIGSAQLQGINIDLSATLAGGMIQQAQALLESTASVLAISGYLDYYSAVIESGRQPYVDSNTGELYVDNDYFQDGDAGMSLVAQGEISTNTGAYLLSAANWQLNAGLALYGNTTVDLFAMTVSLGATSRIVRSDEYYTYIVPTETRILEIAPKISVLIVDDEQRINMIQAEPRDLTISSETRILKIASAPGTLEGARIRRLA